MKIVRKKNISSKEIKNYWEERTVTIKDLYYRDLNINFASQYLTKTQKVLDIGCGNGYNTVKYAKHVKEIDGVDYSSRMIKSAKAKLKRSKLRNLTFETGNVLKFDPKKKYDVIIAERLLVNLQTFDQQKQAIKNIHTWLKSKGLYIMAEASFQGHDKLDELRNTFGLPKVKKHWHNLYIDEVGIAPFLKKHFKIVKIQRFGMYNFISKIIHPLLVNPAEPRFDAKINKIAMQIAKKIPNFQDASHHVIYVLRKK